MKFEIPASGRIRTAVVGAGKMGVVHAKVYHQLSESDFVAVVDTDWQRAKRLAKKYKCLATTSCADVLGRVDAVTIATPTVTHYKLAKIFIENEIAVMIEKPLAANAREARLIVELAKKYNTPVAVGHSERCNPVVQAMKRLHIEPKFIEATRISPYPFRSTDIGVVMDVMIHDIDIILSLAASKIKKIEAVGVGVIDEKEDICNARITFENGCIASITASRLALKTERKVRVFSRQAYLSLDLVKKSGVIISADPNVDVVKRIRRKLHMANRKSQSILRSTTKDEMATGDKRLAIGDLSWPDLLHIEKLDIDDRQPIRLEQEAFLRYCADKRFRPEVSAEEGLAAMECAEKILTSIKEHEWD